MYIIYNKYIIIARWNITNRNLLLIIFYLYINWLKVCNCTIFYRNKYSKTLHLFFSKLLLTYLAPSSVNFFKHCIIPHVTFETSTYIVEKFGRDVYFQRKKKARTELNSITDIFCTTHLFFCLGNKFIGQEGLKAMKRGQKGLR